MIHRTYEYLLAAGSFASFNGLNLQPNYLEMRKRSNASVPAPESTKETFAILFPADKLGEVALSESCRKILLFAPCFKPHISSFPQL